MKKTQLIIITILFANLVQASFFENTVKYLSSDELEGRRSGTNGNEMATNYTVEKFKQYKLKPFAGNYKQEFTIFTKMIKKGDNYLQSGHERDDLFQPITYSLSGNIDESQVVFVGYGITIPQSDEKLKYDDYKNVDVKDKIVLILTGDPGVGAPNSPFRHPDYINYRSLFYKLKNAITHGAKGAIIIQDPLSLSDYPSEPAPFFNAREGGGKRFSIISGYATNAWANKLLKADKTTLIDLQKKITKTQSPQSMVVSQKASMAVNLYKETGKVANVVGVIEGSDQQLKKEVVVIGGHFDHLGYGGESSMDPVKFGLIHNGADDNASGTAMVLKLAKELSQKDLKRTYIFILFNAEEIGLLGSAHFVEMWARHGETYGKLTAMLNFDMVGRYDKEVSIMGSSSGHEWESMLNTLTSKYKMTVKDGAVGSSDHASFTAKKVPSLFFTTGAHEDYHKSTDDHDKINYEAMRGIEKYALELISNIERGPSITFNEDYDTGSGDSGSRGYGAHLGCVPEFGQSDDIVGVLCTRASDNSPAQLAGIIPGDILIKIGDIEIKSIYDLAFSLKYYRAGDVIELAWKRSGKIMRQKITLARSRGH
jgi:aminopeptidase YwaD